MVSLLAIAGLVGVVLLGVVVLVLSARNQVTVTDVRPPPPEGVVRAPGTGPAEVADLLRAGRKIEAIKRYRELTGAGLKEAKDAVEALERGEPAPLPQAPPGEQRHVTQEMASDDPELRGHVSAGRKIEAIKRYRELTSVGLAEAKDAVEALARGDASPAPAQQTRKRHVTGELAIDDAELRGHVSAGRLIDAIKRYRELTGLGLKESKDAIEALRDSLKS
ncbi:MAG: ribosomal protein L7/L12 [Myxococcaceae bacterium]|nr:ribosomal protein L7/L12 [Myxococcaceae bacterium]